MQEGNIIVSEVDFVRLMAIQPHPSLRAELERAIVIPVESIRTDVVTMNAHVHYRDEKTGLDREVTIVFPEEADIQQGKVSILAPVGAALIGLSAGQAIDWEFPDGTERRLTVIAVEQADSTSRAGANHPH
ncbi:nucleoside diphosphate kinase regulator [Aromatoleum petrolei]|uniref:Nucleoside diphosphate kinase regulator n=1 Tax=Aromatoleum petrolei TaxID=76116 RepID=A0ABX1MN11_9RHOO|nr:nucleoside diphosphate kinase regulator [Aromatoleum petrolei]NMF87735.1 nucleoside diphosphate kinase regulator [Aromatoleum petrolei]QTQ38224.1 Transcription elongation factor [Aromatoleum petrolei]